MRILILSGKFGRGHISVAEAIKEKILNEDKDAFVETIDFISYLFPEMSKYFYHSFNFLASHFPFVYNLFNKVNDKKVCAPLKTIVIKKIDVLLEEKCPDLIISVVPLCSQYISFYKRMKQKKLVLYTCITDVSVCEEWISEETDLYYVSSDKTKDYLLSRGVFIEKIVVSGIPIKKEFFVESKYNCCKHVLIMGGGLGLIPNIYQLLAFLENRKDIKTTVILGNNQKLFLKLYEKYKHIQLIGFTNEVYKYMNEADLLITKAGGITIFEAIATETPLLLIKPFLIQEEGNASFIVEKKLGKILSHQVKEDVLSILYDDKSLQFMRFNMHQFKKNFAPVSFLARRDIRL